MSERPRYKSLLSEYRNVIFAIRTKRRDMKFEDLWTMLADALIEAAKQGAGVRMTEKTADAMAAHLLDGMLPTAEMPFDWAPLEREIAKALEKGSEASRARARGLAQALAMLRFPRLWERSTAKQRLELVRNELEQNPWT